MRKFFLLFGAFAFSAGAFAQSSGSKSVVFDRPAEVSPQISQKPSAAKLPPAYPAPIRPAAINKMARTTGVGQDRWYSYFELADINGSVGILSNNTFTWTPLWWDSTVTYRYSTGPGATEWGAVGEIIDPIRYKPFNDTNFTSAVWPTTVTGDDIAVGPTNAYVVDTIRLRAAYTRYGNRPLTVRDTLYITVIAQNTDWTYDTSLNNDWLFVNTSVPQDNSKVWYPTPKYADSINRSIFLDNSSAGAVRTIDTFILNPAVDGHFPDFSTGGERDTLTFFQFPVNNGSGITIPAGQHFAVGVAFKSGDVWTPNVDSIKKFNNFSPVWGFHMGSTTSESGWMPYMHAIDPSDYNGSCYLDSRGRPSENTTTYPLVNHSGRPARWLSSMAVQSKNAALNHSGPNGFFDQFLWLDAHISCTNCRTIRQELAVKKVSNNIVDVTAVPNPTSDKLIISYNIAKATNSVVYLTNAVGQVVAQENIKNAGSGRVVFNTSGLPNGVYLYTISADNSKYTGRVSVVH